MYNWKKGYIYIGFRTLQLPRKIKCNPSNMNQNLYYKFHQYYDHKIDDYYELQKEIEYCIQKGYMKNFVASRHETSLKDPDNQAEDCAPSTLNEFYIIFGGRIGRDTNHKRNAYVRGLVASKEMFPIIQNLDKGKKPRMVTKYLIFTKKEVV